MSVLVLGMGVAMAMVVGAFVLVGMQNHRDHHETAKRLAAGLGLQVRSNDEFVGRYRGVHVRQYSRDLGGSNTTDLWTTTRCGLLADLPRGLVVVNQGFFSHLADLFGQRDIQVGNAFDPLLRITAEDEEGARELLTDPDVVERLGAVLRAEGRVELQGTVLELRVRGRHTDNAQVRLDEAVGLTRALAAVVERHWQGLIDTYQLRSNEDGSVLEGEVSGVPVQVALLAQPQRTAVTGRLAAPFPVGTRVIAAPPGGGAKLGDPVLDGRLSVYGDVAGLRPLLATDAARGPLLEVLLGHPGSVLHHDRVNLVADGRLGRRLARALDSVVTLVRALDGAR